MSPGKNVRKPSLDLPNRNVRPRKSDPSPLLQRCTDIESIEAAKSTAEADLVQTRLPFRKITKEAANEQSKRDFEQLRNQRNKLEEHEEMRRLVKASRKRELGRLRAQKFRAARQEEREAAGVMHTADLVPDLSASPVQLNNAAISRQASGMWKAERNGKNGGKVQQPHKTTNWYHPFLWYFIQKFAARYQYSATFTVEALQREHFTLFKNLHKGTMQKWLDNTTFTVKWSAATLTNIELQRSKAYKGRAGILAKYPLVVEEVKTALTGLRKNGVPVSVTVGRAVLLSIIEERSPEILDGKFKCSDAFVRNFFASVLDMTPRRATRAAAHIPANSDEVCERAFFRLVNIVKVFEIPPSLIVNMDQTGVLYIPGFKQTYETKGAKQVNIIGKDEKRGFTLCVSSVADGGFLPFQQVCGGKTMKSSPDAKSAGMDKALAEGFHFTVAASEKNPTSHYSTLKTMKQYMEKIFQPHYEKVLRDDPTLPKNQRAVLYLDAYPVHLSEAFLSFLRDEYPHVMPVFVPANCTGIFQPADVGLQRIIKHIIKQHFLEELVKSQRQQLAMGVKLDDVKFSNSVIVLRNASVEAMNKVYEFMTTLNGQKIVQMAWRKCSVKEYNLSEATLYDRNIRLNNLEAFLETDKVLSDEIASRKQKKNIIIGQDVQGEKLDIHYDDFNEDDCAIPLPSVVNSAFKIKLPGRCSRYCTHSSLVKESDTGLALISSATEEDLLAFDKDGHAFDAQNLPMSLK